MQGHEIDNSIDHTQQLHHQSVQTFTNRGYVNTMHWSRNDWRDVVLPSVPLSHHYTQGMSYVIRGLDPDQQYEATVQSRYVLFSVENENFYIPSATPTKTLKLLFYITKHIISIH